MAGWRLKNARAIVHTETFENPVTNKEIITHIKMDK